MNMKHNSNRLINRLAVSLLIVIGVLGLGACSQSAQQPKTVADFKSWDEVSSAGQDQPVTILMWGGNESVNQYIDQYVADHVKEAYGISLKRVPMNAPDYITKLLNEKKSKLEAGSADLVWINAENFATAKAAGLLAGPITPLLPNLNRYYDLSAADLNYDAGIPIDGYEAIWGRAQLVISYDAAVVPNPPRTYAELLAWLKPIPASLPTPACPMILSAVPLSETLFMN
ncbi:extracellular solute-binding protein [uncultured Acetobacterium sp.]|uniref:extracellular solute-binding protein n=1 Tax=uncultured Acetobacterium sp. TaxID=217139 RepID=UPI0025F500FD|nr:extracellular solute-binding protein [uncultured Acetobacterium sp.]